VPLEEVHKAAILAARTKIETDPDYTYATARLLLHTIYKEVLGEEVTHAQMHTRYAEYFPAFIKKGVEAELLNPGRRARIKCDACTNYMRRAQIACDKDFLWISCG